jgi:hypothetical protein
MLRAAGENFIYDAGIQACDADLTCEAYRKAWMESGSNGLIELGEKDG